MIQEALAAQAEVQALVAGLTSEQLLEGASRKERGRLLHSPHTHAKLNALGHILGRLVPRTLLSRSGLCTGPETLRAYPELATLLLSKLPSGDC